MGDGPQKRIHDALRFAHHYGDTEGAHHKQWVIDQMVRALTGRSPNYSAEYDAWVAEYRAGENGPDTYEWDEGVAP
jgi:hypothetical protein